MSTSPIQFDIAAEVLSLGINSICFQLRDMKNADTNEEFATLCRGVEEHAIKRYSNTNYEDEPIIQEFRKAHAAVGLSDNKPAASIENLIGYLLKNGRIPHINLAVDIYNMVSIESMLSIGAHDLAAVHGNIHLRLTTGDERYFPLGAKGPKRVIPGEYAYVDDANDILCRLEVKQADKSKIHLDSTNCFFIVQGNSATPVEYITQTAHRLIGLLKHYCGGIEVIV